MYLKHLTIYFKRSTQRNLIEFSLLAASYCLDLSGIDSATGSMLVGSGCIYPSVVESFAWFLYIFSPW